MQTKMMNLGGHEQLGDYYGLWTLIYLFVCFSWSACALFDPIRVGEIDALGGWGAALEATAWRVIIVAIICPFLAVGYAVYCIPELCCK